MSIGINDERSPLRGCRFVRRSTHKSNNICRGLTELLAVLYKLSRIGRRSLPGRQILHFVRFFFFFSF